MKKTTFLNKWMTLKSSPRKRSILSFNKSHITKKNKKCSRWLMIMAKKKSKQSLRTSRVTVKSRHMAKSRPMEKSRPMVKNNLTVKRSQLYTKKLRTSGKKENRNRLRVKKLRKSKLRKNKNSTLTTMAMANQMR